MQKINNLKTNLRINNIYDKKIGLKDIYEFHSKYFTKYKISSIQ